MNHRHYTRIDTCIHLFDRALKSLFGNGGRGRENPATKLCEAALTRAEQKQSAALMRVNHTGEICAQALYQGQALLCRDETIKKGLLQAAREEYDHLQWCETRIRELNGRTSILNPFWFAGSLFIGIAAGFAGRGYNLGFLAETEKQVEAHLSNHLQQLPAADRKSRTIVKTMQAEEAAHANHAIANGAKPLPYSVSFLMKFTARLMTKTVYWV